MASGGKGSKAQVTVHGTTARTTGYSATGAKQRGDAGMKHSPPNTSIPKQAPVNKPASVKDNTKLGPTGRTNPPSPAHNKNSGQPRNMQNTMTGKGSPKG